MSTRPRRTMELYITDAIMKTTQKRLAGACLILNVLLIARVRGAVVKGPINSAVNVGGSSYFNCSYNNSDIQWGYSKNADIPTTTAITDTNCNLVSEFSANFRIEKPASGVCNLIIFDVDLSRGGYYSCLSGSGFGGTTVGHGILIVVDANTSFTRNITGEIEEGEDIVIGMAVTYSGPVPISPATIPPLYPSLSWKLRSNSINIATNSEEVTTTTSSSYIIVTAPVPTVPSYVCTLFFKPPTNPPLNCDNITAPSYTISWNTAETNTSYMHSPNVSSTEYNETSDGCEARILKCEPNAYPPPTIQWTDLKRMETIDGETVTVELNGTYNCLTSNTIRGVERMASANETVPGTFNRTPCKGVSEINATVSWNNRSEINAGVRLNSISRSGNTYIYSSENATEAVLTCYADGIPTPSYSWTEPCNTNPTNPQITAFESGSYECFANNSINDRPFNANITLQINMPAAKKICDQLTPKTKCDSLCILICVIATWFGINILLLIVFLPCYGCLETCRQNVNSEFPWIQRALPCMNKKGCICPWEMPFFIFCSVIGGIIFILFVLISSFCCGKAKKSKGVNRSRDEIDLSTNVRTTPPNSTGQTPKPGDPYRNHQPNPSSHHSNRPPPPHQNHGAMSSSSPVSSGGVVYQDLPFKVDSRPGSRRPIEPIVPSQEAAYAELQRT